MTDRPRRFYRRATVVAGDAGFVVALDDRPVKTPAKAILSLPTAELAAAIAAEWEAQGEVIDPRTMPLTRLAATALDRVSGRRDAVIDDITAYGGSDLLCYRADAPEELVARQHRAWQPLLDWAAERWGATLYTTRGVVPVEQPVSALDALRIAVAAFADFPLTGLASAVQTTGSLIVGLALARARIDAEAAYRLALLDECFQAERWGCDPEAERRRQTLADEIRSARRFIDLARSEDDRRAS
jgi:chaperone required for assembly of F1-ATPase